MALDIRGWYDVYTARFKINHVLPPIQKIKYDHGLSVAREAAALAKAMEWTREDAICAEIAGLVHDIGRFSQVAEYGTLSDAKSVNHAVRGYEVLLTEKPLKRVALEDRQKILDCVRYHNVRTLPAALSNDSMRFVKLIRDADKLDILQMVYRAITSGQIHEHPELLLGVSLHGSSNPKIVESLSKGELAAFENIHCVADLLLLLMSWVFDINYPVTMCRIRDRRLIENLCECLPQDAGLQTASKAILKKVTNV